MQLFGHNRYGPKIRGYAPLFGAWGWVPMQHRVPRAEAYLNTQWHLDGSSRLTTIEMDRKLGRGSAAPSHFWGWGWVRKVAWAEACLRAKCHLDPSSRLVTINMGQKFGVLRHLLGRGAGSPSNTKSPGLRPIPPCQVPS